MSQAGWPERKMLSGGQKARKKDPR